MVEYKQLNAVFASLADPTRRDILERVAIRPMPIREVAQSYDLTFAAVAKHISVLEHARLVSKKRSGKEQIVHLSPSAINSAAAYLEHYKVVWEKRLDRLETLLKQKPHGKR